MKINIGDTFKGYKILEELGGGGMSKVFIAESTDKQTLSTQQYILKLISKSMVLEANNNDEKAAKNQWEKALNEFELTWQIFQTPNDNIAKPIDWYIDEKKSYVIIITEYVDGPSLSKYIERQKAIKVDRAMFYFQRVCEGVKHFHQINPKRAIIHRDLKSDNIMLSQDLRVIKIIDYGIATSFYNNIFESSEGTIYCTANYTTPDILNINRAILDGVNAGDKKSIHAMSEIISPQFDYHALGVILYEMLTGKFPFTETDKETDRQKIQKWNQYDIPILSESIINIPKSIDNIIFRLTASKSENKKYRYKSIDEILEDVKNWNNPNAEINKELIKPSEKRTFQNKDIFDIDALKKNEKVWTKWWFCIFTNVLVVSVVLIVTIILGLVLSGTI